MSVSSGDHFSKITARQISLTPFEIKQIFSQQLRNAGLTALQDDMISENLLSPCHIILPMKVREQITDFIQSLFQIRQSSEYLNFFRSIAEEKAIQDPGNKSILMSYDFHLNENLEPKLIEINTNASFLALGTEMRKLFQTHAPATFEGTHSENFDLNEICENIETEISLFGKKKEIQKVAIIDEQPQMQKLFAEFLFYQKLFEKHGWSVDILDVKDIDSEKYDFIYNRHTDFYLTGPVSQHLREAFLKKTVCFSPNPFEYLLLADKQRNRDWFSPEFLNSLNSKQKEIWDSKIKKHLLEVHLMRRELIDEIWSKRKGLFFKPQSSFGSKQAFKGASISRTAFDKFFESPSIAQEYCAPQEVELETSQGVQKFKFDLRCYAYQGKFQSVLARIYQGQTTNLRAPYGGFAPVSFL